MPIIATAGHVDHGKSTLIEALTGRDPDRWAEEKRRGLTIDLGFAWRQLGEFDVGFVDVPGHERFIKNMLAGMGAVDVALFVVAADEGWKPQSEEHLSVLDLLETRHGVIAITRTDLADDDTIDLTELEILERVEKTWLATWPIVRVSATSGHGMDQLAAALIEQLHAAGSPHNDGEPRLWIDRAFLISGAGLVVTGTLSGGSVTTGDELMLFPGGSLVRVRGLQHHDETVERITPGSRAAFNLTGTDTAERGTLLGRPSSVPTTNRLIARLRSVRTLDSALAGRGAYHLHVGSGSWPVQLRIIDPDIALIRSRTAIPVGCGDRFILRETGRRAVVAGGVVLDPHPPRSGRALRRGAQLLDEAIPGDPNAIANILLTIRGTADLADLKRDSGGGIPNTRYRVGQRAMANATALELETAITAAALQYQSENRLRPGIPKAELATTLGSDAGSVALVVAGAEGLIDDGATIRTVDFEPGLSATERQAWESAKETLESSLAVPRADQLGLDRELLHSLIRDEQLVRISSDLVYLPRQIEEIAVVLRGVGHEFTVAEFRDLIGVTRRQAVPLLEWFDKQGTTRRRGDMRVVR